MGAVIYNKHCCIPPLSRAEMQQHMFSDGLHVTRFGAKVAKVNDKMLRLSAQGLPNEADRAAIPIVHPTTIPPGTIVKREKLALCEPVCLNHTQRWMPWARHSMPMQLPSSSSAPSLVNFPPTSSRTGSRRDGGPALPPTPNGPVS